MNPIKFPQATACLKKPDGMTDEECGELYVYQDGKQCISLWRMSLREKLRVLLSGKIWLGILSVGTQPPVWLTPRTPFSND